MQYSRIFKIIQTSVLLLLLFIFTIIYIPLNFEFITITILIPLPFYPFTAEASFESIIVAHP